MQLDRQVLIRVRNTVTTQCPNRQQLEYTDEIFHSIELEEERFNQGTDKIGPPPHMPRHGTFRANRIRIVLRSEIRLKHTLDASGSPLSYKTADGDTLH